MVVVAAEARTVGEGGVGKDQGNTGRKEAHNVRFQGRVFVLGPPCPLLVVKDGVIPGGGRDLEMAWIGWDWS